MKQKEILNLLQRMVESNHKVVEMYRADGHCDLAERTMYEVDGMITAYMLFTNEEFRTAMLNVYGEGE